MLEDGFWGGWGRKTETDAERLYNAERLADIACSMYGVRENPIPEGPVVPVRKFFAWDCARKLFGKDIRHIWQQTGSCVGASHGNLGNYTQTIEIVKGDSEEFKYIFFPYHYGIGRQLAYGKNAGKGEGSYGGPQSQAILQFGMIPVDTPNLPKHAEYKESDYYWSEAIEMDWSGRDRDGSWDYQPFSPIGKMHLFEQSALITEALKGAEIICSTQTLINVCSTIGYGRLDSDGFNVQDRNWNHSMMFLGADLEWKEPYFALLNNWRADAHPRIKDFYTGELWPPGTMRIRLSDAQKMFRQKDTYIFIGFNGFKTFDINKALYNFYR